jgi:hypothetical protein
VAAENVANGLNERAAVCGEERGVRLRARHCRRIVWAVGAIPLLASSAWAQAPAAAPAPKGVHPATAPMAKPTPPNAKKLLASAETKRAAGDYEGALADYVASDAVAPSPATIEGIAFCNDKLGHFDDALTWYDGFLSNVPPAMQEQANTATARVAAIKAMPGHLHLETLPSNAFASIDGKDAPTHTPLDIELAPGKHVVHVAAPDHDAVDKEFEIASREKKNLALELLVTPPPPPVVAVVPPPPPPPPPAPRSIIPALVTGGLALVAGGIGVGFGVAALNDKSSFNKNPTNATANSGEDAALAADMGFGIGLTLGVTSIILFTTRNEQAAPATPAAPASPDAPATTTPAKASASSSTTTLTAAPFVSSHGGGAAALVRF